MILDVGGEDVTVTTDGASRTARTIAPPEPRVPDGQDVTAPGWTLYLPGGDPITSGSRVTVRGVQHEVQGQPAGWGYCVVVQAVTSLRTGRATLRHPATSQWTTEERTSITAGATYATDVSIGITAQVSRSDAQEVAAEENVRAAPYVVTLSPEAAESREGDEVDVTAFPDDSTLVGRTLRVEHVVRGLERYERQLLCTLVDSPAA